MPIVTHLLAALPELSVSQRLFWAHLLSLWPCVSGRLNFLNLSRYSPLCERTFRRHFAQTFAWARFNAAVVQRAVPPHHQVMLAQDASFSPKSGKKTPGLGWHHNGCAGRMEKGLEFSLVSVVDLDQNTAFALHPQQTLPPTSPHNTSPHNTSPQNTSPHNTEAHNTEAHKTEAHKTEAHKTGPKGGKGEVEILAPVEGCKDLRHLKVTQPYWPVGVRYLAADGAYPRGPFLAGARALGLHLVSRLRYDTHVRTLYHGPQKARGRKREYGDKGRWDELDLWLWRDEGDLEDGRRKATLQPHSQSSQL